jgi:5-methylcytosine-specific restriction endonuclease McrA
VRSTADIAPLEHCQRLGIPEAIFKIVWARQDGKCLCGQDLTLIPYIKDHEPPLGLRPRDDEANNPNRLQLLCFPCNDAKYSADRKKIDHSRRTASKHAEHLTRMAEKYPSRPYQRRGTIRSRGFERRRS